MGRPLGAFDSDELDRPDLNKCPDCQCYFLTETCPLCGKVCPEEMRAGNRKPVRHKKSKNRGQAGRVTFIPWYHTWWFILIMMFWMPIVGIILFFTSPYQRKWKIIGAVAGILYFLAVFLGIGLTLLGDLFPGDPPVNTELSRAEYVATCEEMDAEQYYRADGIEQAYIRMELVVRERVVDVYDESGYATYYICVDPDNDAVTLLLRDCRQNEADKFVAGDSITVYGESESDGEVTVYPDYDRVVTSPCLNAAYIEMKD